MRDRAPHERGPAPLVGAEETDEQKRRRLAEKLKSMPIDKRDAVLREAGRIRAERKAKNPSGEGLEPD